MMVRKFIPACAALGLFIAVYAPAFAVPSLIRPRIELAIPLIIAISLAMALLFIWLLARRGAGFSAFGFAIPSRQGYRFALLLGPPLAVAVVWLSRVFPSKPPIDVSHFPPWMIGMYFVVAAPIQEEIIFRGLIQSFLQQRWPGNFSVPGLSVSPSIIFVTILFGAMHLGSGPAVAIGASALAVLAGELRRLSGSLLPAVLVHALFNLVDALWPGT